MARVAAAPDTRAASRPSVDAVQSDRYELHLIFRGCCAPRDASAIDRLRSSLRAALLEGMRGRLVDLRLEGDGQLHLRFVASRRLLPLEAMTIACRSLGLHLGRD